MLNHAAQSYFFKVNNNLHLKLNTMLQETKYQQHPHIKEAIKLHTQLMFDGNHPHFHKTPENEMTFIDGYLEGMKIGMDLAKEIYRETIEAPTVFLNEGINNPETSEAIN